MSADKAPQHLTTDDSFEEGIISMLKLALKTILNN